MILQKEKNFPDQKSLAKHLAKIPPFGIMASYQGVINEKQKAWPLSKNISSK